MQDISVVFNLYVPDWQAQLHEHLEPQSNWTKLRNTIKTYDSTCEDVKAIQGIASEIVYPIPLFLVALSLAFFWVASRYSRM